MPALGKSRRAKTTAPPGGRKPARRKPGAPPREPAAAPLDAKDFAQQQIERLESMLESLVEKAHDGELGAVDRVLKVLDRLDRYRGYSPAVAPGEAEEDARERILRKLSEVDARRAAAEEDQDAAEAADEASAGA